jgi:hypothetical protein
MVGLMTGDMLMPTIFRLDGYRFYFYSHEPNEPPHVHVDKGGPSMKSGSNRWRWQRTPAFADRRSMA